MKFFSYQIIIFFSKTIESGKLFALGKNSEGQLGLENFESVDSPRPIKFFADKSIKLVGCGSFHVVVVDSGL